MNSRRFCEKSILWVLTYRNSPRKQMHKLYRYGFVDDHTDESWKWTIKESSNITRMGLDYWFMHMDGPLGFKHYKKTINHNNPS